ncbi:MAG: hypothetical protein ACREDR_31305, partial [Blastocatellia bacterium]
AQRRGYGTLLGSPCHPAQVFLLALGLVVDLRIPVSSRFSNFPSSSGRLAVGCSGTTYGARQGCDPPALHPQAGPARLPHGRNFVASPLKDLLTPEKRLNQPAGEYLMFEPAR